MPRKLVRAGTYQETGADLVMTQSDIGRFLDTWLSKGHSKISAANYRNGLESLYEFLPEDKHITLQALRQWRDAMRERYSPATVNTMTAACNGYLAFMGKRELRFAKQIALEDKPVLELTRDEYRRLLSAAKTLEDERAYLLVKTFTNTGLNIQELSGVTVEAAREGWFAASLRGRKRPVRIPPVLATDLLAYAGRQGILSGPIFLQKNGAPLNRSAAATILKSLGSAAQVAQEKCNAKALRYLFQISKDEAEGHLAELVERILKRQMEEEQMMIGWES